MAPKSHPFFVFVLSLLLVLREQADEVCEAKLLVCVSDTNICVDFAFSCHSQDGIENVGYVCSSLVAACYVNSFGYKF